jgi:hypothetical protein
MSASSSASQCPDLARNNGARCLRLIDTLIVDAGSHRFNDRCCSGFVWGGGRVTPGARSLARSRVIGDLRSRVGPESVYGSVSSAARSKPSCQARTRERPVAQAELPQPDPLQPSLETRVQYEAPMQDSLPAGGLAFTGNPLDRYKRFQITFSFSSSGFILAQEGPSFISRTVTQRRLDRRYS